MKLSLNWIKDYVEIPSDWELSRIAYDLTMSTVEVENTIELGKTFDKMLVGVVKEVVLHPNADKLRICKTDIGGGDIRDIVCGGSNLERDMKVAVACPGAVVRWHGEGEPVEIKKAKLRGVESYGMICAPSEMGLSELFSFVEESEILDLSEFPAKAGTPLANALGLDDVILEIDNKSLTNRPDLWGHYGIARELSSIYNLPLKEFKIFESPDVPKLKIEVENSSLCPRYIGVEIEGLMAKASPFELQSRIWRVGMRPINTIVDITNYLMLATGQPTHAFDFNTIKGNINVRNAKDGEKLLLLNGKDLTLSKSDLVIADNERVLGLAGIMGGEEVTVLNQTDKIILEIANFEPYTVRRTASKYELRTESGIRYEKGIDPERCDIAFSLAMEMLSELFPQMKIIRFCDKYLKTFEKKKIDISLDWLEKRLGKRLSNDEISNKLERLGFEIEIVKDNMNITVPTWRSTGDVSLPDDIIEEVARIYGFENFEPMPITTTFEKTINQPEIDLERKIREYLAFRCGMNEIFTYPWIDEKLIKSIFSETNGMLSLSAPPSPNEKYIRSSLLPGLIKATSENLRYFNEFKIFESAQVFFDEFSESSYDKKELLPKHCRNVAGMFVDSFENVDNSFRIAKGIIGELPLYVHAEPLTFEKSEKPIWADNEIWLNIVQNGKLIGDFALLSRKVALNCGIKNSAVFAFEMNIDLLKLYPSRTNKFVRLSEYPLTSRDLSLLFDLSVKWKDILEVINKKHDDLLQDVIYIGGYKGNQISDDKKSVTFKLVIGSLKKTLTSQEIDNCVNNIVQRLEKTLNAKFR